MVWREAKKNADFKALLPTLTEVVTITKRVGEAKAAALGLSLYDALLDEYEPGGRCQRIDTLFAELEAFLPAMLQQVMERQKAAGAPLPLDGPFPVDAQRALGRRDGAARWASTSITAGSTSRRIPSPAAPPTTCASPRATTRTISPAP